MGPLAQPFASFIAQLRNAVSRAVEEQSTKSSESGADAEVVRAAAGMGCDVLVPGVAAGEQHTGNRQTQQPDVESPQMPRKQPWMTPPPGNERVWPWLGARLNRGWARLQRETHNRVETAMICSLS